MRIETIYPAASVEVECDGYVPLVIRFDGYYALDFWVPIYWRTGDFERSLVEIGVNPSSGAICEVVLVCLPGIETTALVSAEASDETGLPGASLSQWPVESQWSEAIVRTDVNQRVVGSLVNGELILLFGDVDSASLRHIRCDRVAFLIDPSRNLRGLRVADLSPREIENLRFTLAPPKRRPGGHTSHRCVSDAERSIWRWPLALAATAMTCAILNLAATAQTPLSRVLGSAENIAIVRDATRAEAYRLAPPEGVDPQFTEVSPLEYEVTGGPVAASMELAEQLKETLLSPETYPMRWMMAKECGLPVYGVKLSFYQGDERVDVYLCFGCSDLAVVREESACDPADFSRGKRVLLDAVKELFPQDAEIQAIRE